MGKKTLILNTAKELIVEKGVNGFNMKDLAKYGNMAQGTPYLYFKNKEELLIEVILSMFSEMENIFKEISLMKIDLMSKIERVLREPVCFSLKHRDMATVLFNDFFSRREDESVKICINTLKKNSKRIKNILINMLEEHKKELNNNFLIIEMELIIGIFIHGLIKGEMSDNTFDIEKKIQTILKVIKLSFIKG